MKRRDERKLDRKLLELAKLKHAEAYGKNTLLNRVKIRRFKKDLRKQFEDGELDLEGFDW